MTAMMGNQVAAFLYEAVAHCRHWQHQRCPERRSE
jgi:hypothetical protein